jgi:hypothetical protein
MSGSGRRLCVDEKLDFHKNRADVLSGSKASRPCTHEIVLQSTASPGASFTRFSLAARRDYSAERKEILAKPLASLAHFGVDK